MELDYVPEPKMCRISGIAEVTIEYAFINP